jgi:hypothetical protein
VLIIIVLIVSLIFQQSHNAWSAGTRQADADTTLRTVLGTMARDLTHAIDAAPFGNILGLVDQPKWQAMTAANDFLVFLNLDGTNRAVQVMDYALSSNAKGGLDLTRVTYQLRTSGTNWEAFGASATNFVNGDFPLSAFRLSVATPPSGPNSTGLPHRVDLAAKVTRSGSLAILSGLSAGPDGDYTTDKDNVVVNP